MAQHFEVRKANSEDLKLIYQRMILEQWNPALYDFHGYPNSHNFHAFVGVLDGEVVSSCFALIYQEQFAFFGCYLVLKPGLRGKGYGLEVYKHRLTLMEKLGVKSIGCDADLAQTHNYAKHGFVEHYLNRRFVYLVQGTESATENTSKNPLSATELALFEADFLYEPREDFMTLWLSHDPTIKFASIKDNQGKLIAVGIARQAQIGFRIGPLYADSLDNAQQIFCALAEQLQPNTKLMIDIPEANSHADHFIKQLGLASWGIECMRMYRGEAPQVAMEKIYGMCSLEIG